ncbi:SMP-30/gluconolactonase/LRE family protein [Croceivirga thetidis]|uniref:Arylesterase n=1 Tax=Croceivirga thetidis TaxID=2721623 RepID=A0ABX1GUE0_9FLAO|nr:SMP-30/gluconolactonase/LRE family protein [Croceivirga thetidis]NKI32681.1 hypothetical protein [Croceivirga thetidis]
MRKRFIVLLAIVLVLGLYILYIFNSTGYFRKIENKMQGSILKEIPIAGVEDITVDEDDNFAIFISYDRAAERDGNPKRGGIYTMDLGDENLAVTALSEQMDLDLLPHGISLFQVDSTKHKLFVANHADGESVEVFDLFHTDSLVHVKTIKDEMIYAINDLVAVSENEFYFTNDHYYENTLGRLAENYLGLAKCETVYFDGSDYTVVDNSLAYANGINYDANRNLLFVASPRGFKIIVFSRLEDGKLDYLDTIDTGTGVDNLEFDKDGNIWSGSHPNLLAFTAYAKGKLPNAPSEIVKIDYRGQGDYSVETTFLDDGAKVSATSVAAPYKDLILVGNVMDDHFLILKN